jgi:hypothetical protein
MELAGLANDPPSLAAAEHKRRPGLRGRPELDLNVDPLRFGIAAR